jgi:hypothetical protein
MDRYIIYNAEHQVLICGEHKCGITPPCLDRHFREEHKEVTLETRKVIIANAQTLTLCDPAKVTIFTQKITPVQGLEILDGYRCEFPEG